MLPSSNHSQTFWKGSVTLKTHPEVPSLSLLLSVGDAQAAHESNKRSKKWGQIQHYATIWISCDIIQLYQTLFPLSRKAENRPCMKSSVLSSMFFIVCLYGLVMLFVLFILVLTAHYRTVIYISNEQKHSDRSLESQSFCGGYTVPSPLHQTYCAPLSFTHK